MTRAVHGLQSKDVFFHGEGEHVVTVVLPVTRRLPKLAVIDVGGGHFLEASSPVLLLAQQHSSVSEQRLARTATPSGAAHLPGQVLGSLQPQEVSLLSTQHVNHTGAPRLEHNR